MNDVYLLREEANEVEIINLEDYLREYYTDERIEEIIDMCEPMIFVPYYGDTYPSTIIKALGIFNDAKEEIIEGTFANIEDCLINEAYFEFDGDILSYDKKYLELYLMEE